MINECRWQIRESPGQYRRLGIYVGAINYCYSKLHLSVGRGTGSVSDIFCINYKRAIWIKKDYVYSKTKLNVFLNIPFMVVKNCRLQNVLKETKSHIFCLFSYCRFSFYQCFANQLLEGTVVLMQMILN